MAQFVTNYWVALLTGSTVYYMSDIRNEVASSNVDLEVYGINSVIAHITTDYDIHKHHGHIWHDIGPKHRTTPSHSKAKTIFLLMLKTGRIITMVLVVLV